MRTIVTGMNIHWPKQMQKAAEANVTHDSVPSTPLQNKDKVTEQYIHWIWLTH
jgi:hypothetical protein